MRTEFLLTPPLNHLPVALVEFCPQLSTTYVSVLQVCRLYLHITPILQLHVTGRGTVVLQLEQHILVTVTGMLTVIQVHQQVQCIRLTPICTLMRGLQLHIHPGLHLVLFHLNFLHILPLPLLPPPHTHLQFLEAMVLILLAVAYTRFVSR